MAGELVAVALAAQVRRAVLFLHPRAVVVEPKRPLSSLTMMGLPKVEDLLVNLARRTEAVEDLAGDVNGAVPCRSSPLDGEVGLVVPMSSRSR